MVDIIPFRGVLYNRKIIRDYSSVIAPPYDIISKDGQENLYKKSPYNIIRLILVKEEPGKDRYLVASDTFNKWLNQNILVEDERPSIYSYRQTYTLGGKERTRKGFIALLRLEEYTSGNVLPHERTLLSPKEDRLRLMEACNAQLSPVFGLYSDPHKRIESIMKETGEEDMLFDIIDDEGIRNTFCRIDDQEKIRAVTEVMRDRFVFIADGHHRYETALAYRDIMREKTNHSTGEEPFNYVMIYLSNMEDEGFTILPTHRLIYNLTGFKGKTFLVGASEFFTIEEVRFDDSIERQVREDFFKRIEQRGQSSLPAFGLFIKGMNSYFVLTLKDLTIMDSLLGNSLPEEMKRLDLSVLHHLIINTILGIEEQDEARQKHIDYVKDRDQAVELVKSYRYQMAFILNPPRINEIVAIAKKGFRMPQKSTYFFPKLLSGLVIHRMCG